MEILKISEVYLQKNQPSHTQRSRNLNKAKPEVEGLMDGPAKGDPLAPRALPEEKQEKEQQVLPKPTRTSCSNSDALMLVIRSLPDKMDRWQAAASCALASAFGPTGWKEILPQFWLDEAQDLFSDSSFTAGPFKTVVLKKKAAKISKMPIERVAQTVPPELVGFVRQILLERGVEAEMQALEERKDSNLDSHITLTRALTEYKLNRDDIANLHFESRTNPHSNPYRNAAPMRLYTLRDIIKTALLKHGGPSGLSAVREGVAVRKEIFSTNMRKSFGQLSQKKAWSFVQSSIFVSNISINPVP